MKKPRHRRRRHSLFAKLALVLVVTGVLVNVLVAFAGRALFDRGPVAPRLAAVNARKYIEYLEKDLGLPPDRAKLEALAKDLGIGIRIDFRGEVFASEPDLPPPEVLVEHVPRAARHIGVQFGHTDGRFFFLQPRGATTYAIFGPRGVKFAMREEVVIVLAIALTLTVLAAFFALKRLLAPVRDLETGVLKLAAGDLVHRVPERGSDELAGLAQSFNEMTDELRAMLAAKEQLLLDVSHELRSPMTRMRVALEMMDDSKLKAMITEDLLELDKLTGDLLDSARLSPTPKAVPLSRVDLAALGAQVAFSYQGRSPGVRCLGDASGVIVAANEAHARRALVNLLENALKYSPEGAKPVEVRAVGTRLEVRDYGVGIADAELDKVFEPFYRVDKARTRGGFGLGLALVKRLMQAQAGNVVLESREGEGTTATLEFTRWQE